MLSTRGFTLLELMVSVTIVGVLSAIAIPNFTDFIVKMRVDNEISQLYRLLFIARNTAINTRRTVTVCPLSNLGQCDTDWQKQLSAFIDINANKIYEPNLNERVIKSIAAVRQGEKLHYGLRRNGVIYAPTGRLAGWGSNGTFRYCPKDHLDKTRGIRVATSGRLYVSSDTDHDNKDEDRSGRELRCR